ncbi:hypothetical protein FACS1894208_00670 [Clostridia bacterium]|nr:hypothetical protein FACS1894208_00670 [Clostridia bacterium]
MNVNHGQVTKELLTELNAILAAEVPEDFFDQLSDEVGDTPEPELQTIPATLQRNNADAIDEAKSVRAGYIRNHRRGTEGQHPEGFDFA